MKPPIIIYKFNQRNKTFGLQHIRRNEHLTYFAVHVAKTGIYVTLIYVIKKRTSYTSLVHLISEKTDVIYLISEKTDVIYLISEKTNVIYLISENTDIIILTNANN